MTPVPRPILLVTQPQSTGLDLSTPAHEQSLIAEIRAGDEGAFELLYTRYHDRLWRFAYGYLRSSEIAEDVVQDVFLSLWRGRAEWQVTTAAAWLYGAVRRQALKRLRDQRTSDRLLTLAGAAAGAVAMGTRPAGVHEQLEAGELDAQATRMLAELPERSRAALTLRWKHDLSASEIAQALDTSPGAVRVLLTRGRHILATLLGPRM